jgi:hypothetical protein
VHARVADLDLARQVQGGKAGPSFERANIRCGLSTSSSSWSHEITAPVTPDTNRNPAMNSPTHRWRKVRVGRRLNGANRTRPDRADAGSGVGRRGGGEILGSRVHVQPQKV